MVREMVSDPALAEDLTQDALEIGLRHDVGTVGNLRRWFRGVAKDLLRQSYRGQIRREQREQRVTMERDDFDPPMHELMERVEIQQQVARAVLKLPLEHRRLLILRYYEQQSVSQIAEALGISENAAGLRIHRAKAMLRSQLQSSLGSDWRMLAIPISVGVTKVSLATAATSVLAMNKFTKVALILAAILVGSFPFWNMGADVESPTDLLGPAVALANLEEPSVNNLSVALAEKGNEPKNARLAISDEFSFQVVNSKGQGIPNAYVQIYEECFASLSGGLYKLPMTLEGPLNPTFSGRTNAEGNIALPFPKASTNTAVFARADYYIMRGMILRSNLIEFDQDRQDYSLSLTGFSQFIDFKLIEEDGTPIEGLSIHCSIGTNGFDFQDIHPPGTSIIQNKSSDSEGVVRFENLPPGVGWFSTPHPIYLPWSGEYETFPSSPPSPILVVLSKGESIPVRVVDRLGNPVQSAEIYYANHSRLLQVHPMILTPFIGPFKGTTSENGRLLVHGLKKEDQHHLLAIAGRSWIHIQAPQIGELMTITMPPVFEFRAKFELPNGKPASGAKISFVDFDNPRPQPELTLELPENGQLTAVLREGNYGFESIHEQGSYQSKQPLQLRDNIDLGTIVIPNPAELNVEIVDEITMLPISHARAFFPPQPQARIGTGPNAWQRMLASARTKIHNIRFSGSSFVTKQLFSGEHTLVIEADGYSTKNLTFTLPEVEPFHLVVELQPACTLEINLLDSSGAPAANRALYLVSATAPLYGDQRSPNSKDTIRFARTGANGRAVFNELLPGKWCLEPGFQYMSGFVIKQFDLGLGTTNEFATLPGELDLKIHVVANGKPIPDARLKLHRKIEGMDMPFFFHNTEKQSDQDGDCLFKNVLIGEYVIVATHDGFSPLEIPISLNSANQQFTVEFKGATVEGMVTNAGKDTWVVLYEVLDPSAWNNDDPIAGIIRQFSSISNKSWPSPSFKGGKYLRIKADDFGKFKFPAVPPAEYLIFAWSKTSPLPVPTSIQISTAPRNGIELSLQESASLQINVTGLTAELREHEGAYLRVEISTISRKNWRSLGLFTKDSIQAFQGLREGEQMIHYGIVHPKSKTGHAAALPALTKRITLIKGQAIEVSIDVSDFH